MMSSAAGALHRVPARTLHAETAKGRRDRRPGQSVGLALIFTALLLPAPACHAQAAPGAAAPRPVVAKQAKTNPASRRKAAFRKGIDLGLAVSGDVLGVLPPGNSQTAVDGVDVQAFGSADLVYLHDRRTRVGLSMRASSGLDSEDVQLRTQLFGYVRHSRTTFALGYQPSASDRLSLRAPFVGFGVLQQGNGPAQVPATLTPYDIRRAFRMSMISSPAKGLQIGVSWAPKAFADGVNAPRHANVVALGARMQFGKGGKTLELSASGVRSQLDGPVHVQRINSWGLGGRLRLGEVAASGAYIRRGGGNSSIARLGQWEANGGVVWRKGRAEVGLVGALQRSRRERASTIGTGAEYELTNHLSLVGDLSLSRREQTVVNMVERQTTTVRLGLRAGFSRQGLHLATF